MSVVALARLERPRDLVTWSWALAVDRAHGDRVNVRTVAADGSPATGAERAHAQHTDIPKGAAAWMGSARHAAPVPCVVVGRTEDGRAIRVLTPRGEVESPPEDVWPIPAPGARPHAAGPALVAARTDLARVFVDPQRFALRWMVTWLRGVHERDGLAGATWIDVALLPHQIATVREVLGSPSVRHILADEVGLGKTVEALMIWSALSAHDRSMKCVVATPRSLVTQWCLEVRRRVEHRLLAKRHQDIPPVFMPEDGRDVLEEENMRGLVIAEHSALPDLARLRPAEGAKRDALIDMLIIDEAHSLNSEQRSAVEKIAKTARHLLLLTATPREGRRGAGAARDFRRGFAWATGLVDPKWPPLEKDFTELELERALERTVDESLARAREYDEALAQGEIGDALRGAAAVGALSGTPIPDGARSDARSFLRASTLLERVLRNRRRTLETGLASTRRLIRVPVEYREEEIAVLEAVRAMDPTDRAAVIRQACSSWDALAAMPGGKTTALRAKLDVIREARAAQRPDAKLEALLDLCARIWEEDPSAKIVIRCDYVETRDLLSDRLRSLLSIGGLRPSTQTELEAWQGAGEDVVGPVARLEKEQDAMLEAIQRPTEAGRSMLANLWAFESSGEGSAQALVASDEGATGLNLQFASALILYDLPWTPGMTEQWIGRLDRIGQRAGEVRVYTMSHRALPTERLLDVYLALGLFDQRGFHVSAEIERAINDLLRPSDADESSWDEAMSDLQRRLNNERQEDPSEGMSLELPAEPLPPQEEARLAVQWLLDTLPCCGFTCEARNDGSTKVEWPVSVKDSLWLPEASRALRPPEANARLSPEELAALRQQKRPLNITDQRLGGGRWLRQTSVDLLSPRHPLFGEIEADLLRDPSLAVGGFRCDAAATKTPPGLYLLTQTQSFPALGGEAIAWRCDVPPAALQDPELSQLWTTVNEALRRMMRVRCRATLLCGAWACGRGGDALQPQSPEQLARLLAALPQAQQFRATERSPRIEAVLSALERPPATLPDEIVSAARDIAEEVRREAALRLGRVIAWRQSQVESAGEGSAMRGIRDARSRAFEAAQALRRAIEDLPNHARHGAAEAATLRVIAAAVVEVR